MPTTAFDVYERLAKHFGKQHWWPGETKFEIIVGAVLTQNTAWSNVELAIENLRDASALKFSAMHQLSSDELSELIRPAGYYNLKAKRLRNLLQFIDEEYDGAIDDMFSVGMMTLREQLLGVNGIGPETADSILLYAGEQPTFVVDAYTARMVKRHEWVDEEADYYAIKDYFESQLNSDTQLFNEYHALIVQLGKSFCKPKPVCQECPLCDLLPESSELRPDER
ncbi:endonuclease III domain-containing protein [Planctomycetota bacterium]